MLRYLLSVYLAACLGALAGALIGFGVQQATNQAGWVLVIGSLGACAGGFWAGLRRANGLPFWTIRTSRTP